MILVIAWSAFQPGLELFAEQGRLDSNNAPAIDAPAPDIAEHYRTAKRWLFEEVVAGRRATLYCGCPFDPAKRPDLAACGYVAGDNPERARRVEVEHVVPASWIGRGRACWRQKLCTDGKGRRFKGRKCCLAIDPAFRRAYNDLTNLQPVIGEVNEARRNYALGEVAGEPRAFGRCDFEVDRQSRRAEPRPAIRGDVARIHLYMEAVHGVRLTAAQRVRYEAWSVADPPDETERERDARIARLQGAGNPLVTEETGAGF